MRSFKQNLILVAIALVIILVVVGISTFPWLLLLPVVVLVIGYPVYILRRTFALRGKGYFLANTKQHAVIYEERIGTEVVSVPIHTELDEPGCHLVIVPSRDEWQRSAPAWAKNRRDEIFKRVIEGRPKGWAVLPEDWMADGH